MAKKAGWYWYVILILLIALAGMFLWGYFGINAAKKSVEKERAVIQQKAEQVISARTQQLLRLSVLPMTWVVRREVMKGNYEQVREYFSLLVQEPGIRYIFFVDNTGKIVVSTDEGMQGTEFSRFYPDSILEVNEVSITGDETGRIISVSPVMGLNARLGSLVLIYESEK
ncbi:MAG: hypothetical protein ACPLN0_06205 [Candidatus Hydrothermia bacterium]